MNNFENTVEKRTMYINSEDRFALISFKSSLRNLIKNRYDNKEIILLCIGTDRATGDSLGPIIGHNLKKLPLNEKIYIYGTLEEPVHAQNLESTIEYIQKNHINPFIIAIDACLGSFEHISHIMMGDGGIKPGAGVRKNLPEVGNVYITGIVNSSCRLEFSVLQSTRLSVVMKMAEIISNGIFMCLRDI